MYTFEVHNAAKHLVRARCIQSRHSQQTKYTAWVQFNSTTITGTYCTCGAGARTIGMCAHAASVVWYLGYARHEGVVLVKNELEEVIMDCKGVEDGEDEEE